MILLTPGPCMTSEGVRQAAALPDLNHRDPEYLSLVQEVKRRLLGLYTSTTEDWHSYLLGGSGTLAVEAMVTSCIRTGPVLILENGYYSSRIREVLEIHGIPYKALAFGWLEPINLDAVRLELQNGYEAVLAAHNETTTGRLNDINAIGVLAKAHGARCLVDAMSSFGADAIDFEDLDAVCSSANKCLHGLPGVSFVLMAEELAKEISSFPRRSYYMSLPMYSGDNPPLTPPVPVLQALRTALREYPEGGAAAREVDYRSKRELIRSGLSEMGLNPVLGPQESSVTLTTANLPIGWTYEKWFEANYNAGYVLYGCKGELKRSCFQVSNMGDLTICQIEDWIKAAKLLLTVN